MRTNDSATLVFRHGANVCEQLVRHNDECHLRAADIWGERKGQVSHRPSCNLACLAALDPKILDGLP